MPPSFDPTYPLYPVCSFLGFILCLIPLPWQLLAWNSGTCAYIFWTSLACLVGFVNSIVWKGSISNPSPVWCDISSKIIIGVSVGIPASILCISRRLHSITAMRAVSITVDDKRKTITIDLCISLGLPALVMVLHYIVQGHRFDILQDIGCYPVVYNALPAYFLFYMWPVLLGLLSFVYSGLTLRAFWVRRAQFAQLVNSASAMSPSRYLRLMLLAVVDMALTIPLGAFTIYQSVALGGVRPWISWADTHFGFSRVDRFPAMLWRSNRDFLISVEVTRWLPVFCAFTFFALFGLASDARSRYSAALSMILKPFGYHHSAREAPPRSPGIPSWVKPLKLSSPASEAPSSVASRQVPWPSKGDQYVGAYDVEKALPPRPPSYPEDAGRRSLPHHLVLDLDHSDCTFSELARCPSSLYMTAGSQSSLQSLRMKQGAATSLRSIRSANSSASTFPSSASKPIQRPPSNGIFVTVHTVTDPPRSPGST